ncbi:MAG TPA: ComF family protein [Planctomycetes bacterium]|nr:ComF family protein [Planctomycetota bacterium]HIJ71976.1 ComF family protein [Planctomycetota bacterium]
MISTILANFLSPVGGLCRPALEGLNHLLWPAVCNSCGTSISEDQKGLCRRCWDELLACAAGDYCSRCGRDASKYAAVGTGCANCQDRKLHFDGIARGGVYDGSLRNMILAFKFRDRTELDSQLCFMVNSAFAGSEFLDQIDVFVAVPLHWRRRLERGYNQSLILCRGIEQAKGKISSDFVRTRYTARQWNLSPARRRRNVAGAFAVRKGHDFAGRTVCLVDDITTSGATLNECAKTLKQAGAEMVFAVVAAVAMQDGNG